MKGQLQLKSRFAEEKLHVFTDKRRKRRIVHSAGGFGENPPYCCPESKSALQMSLNNSCPLDPATLLPGTYSFSYLFVGCCFLCLFFCLVAGSLQHTNNSKRTVTTMAYSSSLLKVHFFCLQQTLSSYSVLHLKLDAILTKFVESFTSFSDPPPPSP